MKQKLAAQLYTLRDFQKTPEDIDRTLGKVAKIGYSAVQLSGSGPIDPEELAKLLKKHSLKAISTHISWERLCRETDAMIEEHRSWGCAHPAIGGLSWANYGTLEGITRFISELKPVAEKLAKAGMDFSYHNHNQELVRFGKKTWLEQLYEQAPESMLKAEIDTYWIQAGGGNPAEWVRRYNKRMPILHLKDMAVVMGEKGKEVRFAEIGEGNLDWKSILKAADDGTVAWYCVEQDDCYGRDPFESLAISFKNLNELGYN